MQLRHHTAVPAEEVAPVVEGGGHTAAHAAIGTTNSFGVRTSPRLQKNSTSVHFSGSLTEFVGTL